GYGSTWSPETCCGVVGCGARDVVALVAEGEIIAGVGVAVSDRAGLRGGGRVAVEQGCRRGVGCVAADGDHVAPTVLGQAPGWPGRRTAFGRAAQDRRRADRGGRGQDSGGRSPRRDALVAHL